MMTPTEITQLSILAQLAKGPKHGYALIRLLSPDKTGTGAIYRTLAKLDREGLVQATWDTPKTGPARREYALTDLGWERLITERQEFHIHVQEWVALLQSIPRRKLVH